MWKRSIQVKISNFLSQVTSKFDGWPQKTIGHLLFAASSFEHRWIQTPWMNSNSSYSPETPNLGQNRWSFEPWDLEIWQMTLKNNRAPLLSNIKLCASFHHYMSIQTVVTVRKQISGLLICFTQKHALHMHQDSRIWFTITEHQKIYPGIGLQLNIIYVGQ